jgi:hypothetical protein
MKKQKKLPFTLMLAAACLPIGGGEALADERTFTLDADFDEGTIVNLNHDPNHDQLQLNDAVKPLPYINIPASARGTVVRVHTETGAILGESEPRRKAGN